MLIYIIQFLYQWRTIIRFPCHSAAPAGPPQYLSVSSKNSTSLTLTWQAPPASQQNGDIQLYTISLKERETDMTLEYTAHGLMFTVHPLHPHYHYEARVRAETISPGPYTSGSVQTQLNEAGMTERRVM